VNNNPSAASLAGADKQHTAPLFKNSLRNWQAQWKARKAREAAPPNVGNIAGEATPGQRVVTEGTSA
jgi:hypothetical protein